MAGRDEGPAPGALAPMQGVAPVAIIDFLANAEAVVHRLGQHTGVDDWVLTRRLGDEWVVLAGHGAHGYRPGDVLDRPDGVVEHLAAMAASWTGDVVVDLTAEAVGREAGGGDVSPLPGVVPFPLWAGEGLFGAVCALPATVEEESSLRDAGSSASSTPPRAPRCPTPSPASATVGPSTVRSSGRRRAAPASATSPAWSSSTSTG